MQQSFPGSSGLDAASEFDHLAHTRDVGSGSTVVTKDIVYRPQGCDSQNGRVIGTLFWIVKSLAQLGHDVSSVTDKKIVSAGRLTLNRKQGGPTQGHQGFKIDVRLQGERPEKAQIGIYMAVESKGSAMLRSPNLDDCRR